MRLFVAVRIPEEALSEIHKVQLDLQTGLNGSIRWTNPASIHLTLKFLGETPANKITEISNIMDEICNQVSWFSLVCRGIGVFPNIKQPSVIWMGLEYPPELLQLQAKLESKLRLLGFAAENRAFSPHLTLGRVHTSISTTESEFLKQKMADCLPKKIVAFNVNSIELIKSDLKPSGPVYTTQRISHLIEE